MDGSANVTGSTTHPRCNQCGKPAVVSFEGHPLCIEHNLMLERARELEHTRTTDLMNFTLAMFEAQAGLPGLLPRYKRSAPLQGDLSMTVNNISVKDSIVGSVNTGHIHSLDISISRIQRKGDLKLADSLKSLAQAVLDSAEMAAAARNEVVECLEHLSTECQKPPELRATSVGRMLVHRLDQLLNIGANLTTLWGPLRVLLDPYFSLGNTQ